MTGERPLVLVADDEDDILLLVSTVLTSAGFEVLAARDGREALDLARACAPRVAVLDVSMPHVGGIEVLQQLRADEATARIPVVFLSALAQEADVARGYAEGASNYVSKPFKPTELVAAVRNALG